MEDDSERQRLGLGRRRPKARDGDQATDGSARRIGWIWELEGIGFGNGQRGAFRRSPKMS